MEPLMSEVLICQVKDFDTLTPRTRINTTAAICKYTNLVSCLTVLGARLHFLSVSFPLGQTAFTSGMCRTSDLLLIESIYYLSKFNRVLSKVSSSTAATESAVKPPGE